MCKLTGAIKTPSTNQRASETHSTAAVPMHSLYISATKSYVSYVILRCVGPPCIALCSPGRVESCVSLWRGFFDPGNVSIWDTDAVDDGGAWNVSELEMGNRY